MNNCSGCGAKLQYDHEDKVGYTTNSEQDLCVRCFRIIHYHELKIVDLHQDINNIINMVNNTNYYCFYFIDLCNLNSEAIKWFKAITQPKCLVISKADIIPSFLHPQKIKEWLKEEYDLTTDILYLSAKKTQDVKNFQQYLEKKNNTTCFFLGMTNVGKSTFINSLLKNSGKNRTLTISEMPNTTLDFLKIKIDQYTIIDSPGFAYQKFPYQDLALIKKLNVKKMLKPKIFQMKKQETLAIGDWLIHTEQKCDITLYLSNQFVCKKVFQKKEMSGQELNIPSHYDLVIKGIGFIYFNKPCKIKIEQMNEFDKEVRKSFLGKDKA